MAKWTIGRWLGALLVALAVAGCGGGGANTGTLSVEMTDATLPGFRAIYVTIDEVQAHSAGGEWMTVGTPGKTVNLLTLVNGVRLVLGVAELPAGHYTQLRLRLATEPDGSLNLLYQSHPYANYFIDDSDTPQQLKVPSGLQSGIKIVNGFDVNANQTTELLLDFDAARSVVKAGASGQWLLKPTIKVLDTADYSIVSGTVSDGEGHGVSGVIVSAQSVDDGALDPKDEVIVHAATVTTGEDGGYKLFLAPGSYNLVAFRAAYEPVCSPLTTTAGSVQDSNFALALTDQVGAIEGTVTIDTPADDQHATLAFRRSAVCGAATVPIEVGALNVAAGGNYSQPLPAQPAYQVVGWTFDRPTQTVDDVTVAVGDSAIVNFDF